MAFANLDFTHAWHGLKKHIPFKRLLQGMSYHEPKPIHEPGKVHSCS